MDEPSYQTVIVCGTLRLFPAVRLQSGLLGTSDRGSEVLVCIWPENAGNRSDCAAMMQANEDRGAETSGPIGKGPLMSDRSRIASAERWVGQAFFVRSLQGFQGFRCLPDLMISTPSPFRAPGAHRSNGLLPGSKSGCGWRLLLDRKRRPPKITK